MTKRKCLFATTILLTMSLTAPLAAWSATQTQIDEAWKKGIWWLFMNQSGDGFWKSTEGTQIPATALAIEALNNAPLKSYPFHKGVTWLVNARAASTDSLARQAIALRLGGVTPTAYLDRLKTFRNLDFAWGAYGQYETSFPDTPIALSAIRIAQYAYTDTELLNAVYCEVLPNQRASGVWSYMRNVVGAPSVGASGSVLPTALNLMELKAIQIAKGWNSDTRCGFTNSITTSLSDGKSWLLQRRNGDNGIGDNGVSTLTETAVAYKALKELGETTATLGPIEDYLINRQNTNGSWGGDALRTALVLTVLPPPSPIVVADTDGDGVPDSVEALMNKNPAVRDSGFLAQGGGNTGPGLLLSDSLSVRVFKDRPATISLPISSGQGPFTWRLVAGALPPGLTFNPAGYISGTGTVLGTWGFTYSVTDATAASASTLGEIKVVPYGDWNGDGVVDGKDSAIIVNIINSILLDD